LAKRPVVPMYDDTYVHEYLSHYGAGVLADFFLLLDKKTKRYSICYFGTNKHPMVIVIDDEDLALVCVDYLGKNNVSRYGSLAEAEAEH
jgi:hypothetical protein